MPSKTELMVVTVQQNRDRKNELKETIQKGEEFWSKIRKCKFGRAACFYYYCLPLILSFPPLFFFCHTEMRKESEAQKDEAAEVMLGVLQDILLNRAL